MNKHVLRLLGAADYPKIYLETWVEPTDPGGGYVVQFHTFFYRDTAAVRTGNGEKSVAIAIAYPGEPVRDPAKDTATTAVLPLKLGTLRPPVSLGWELLQDYGGRIPAAPKTANGISAVNTYAVIAETAEPELAAQFILAILKDKEVREAAIGLLKPPDEKEEEAK